MRPSLGDLLDLKSKQSGAKQRGPVPAEVVSYDRTTQTCNARALVNPNGTALPVVPAVPVHWLSGNAGSITVDLSPGDIVYLVPAEADISRWSARGLDGAAATGRRFDLADSIAIAGIAPSSAPLAAAAYAAGAIVVAGADIRLGSSAASDFVALASLVLGELNAIKSWADLHIHNDSLGAPTTSPTVPMPAPGSVAATKVKAE